jgi:hypothetical protein
MRHLKAHRKLGGPANIANSMLRNLATSLINSREERIVHYVAESEGNCGRSWSAHTLSRRAHN